MDGLGLTRWQRRRLEQQLHETTDAHVFRRTLAVLEVDRGICIASVARSLGVTRQAIYNWVDIYLERYDPESLADAPRSGRPSAWSDGLQDYLSLLMTTTPDRCGYFAVNWTVPLLQEHLRHTTGRQLSVDSIRRGLSQLGYVWKRSRYVLSPDPEEEKKTPNSQQNQGFAGTQCAVGPG